MSKTAQLRATIVIAACWIVLMPPIWAYSLSTRFGFEYPELLGFYIPEMIVAALSVVLLPAAWMFRRWAIPGLVVAAVLLPVLKLGMGGPTLGAWPASSALLLLLAWGIYSQRRIDG